MQVWVRLGTVVSLTLAAATLPVSARSPSAAPRKSSPDPDKPAPTDQRSPALPAAPADEGYAGDSPVQPSNDRQAKHAVPVLQITPNADVWEAGGARTLGGGTGPALLVCLLSGDQGVPLLATAHDRRPVSPIVTSCRARRAWLVCRYPHAPPAGR